MNLIVSVFLNVCTKAKGILLIRNPTRVCDVPTHCISRYQTPKKIAGVRILSQSVISYTDKPSPDTVAMTSWDRLQ